MSLRTATDYTRIHTTEIAATFLQRAKVRLREVHFNAATSARITTALTTVLSRDTTPARPLFSQLLDIIFNTTNKY